MKKIILYLSIFLSISAYSQTMTLINNTSDVIEVPEIWVNDYCLYNYPTVFAHWNAAPLASTNFVGPFSAATIMLGVGLEDYEYVKLNIYPMTALPPSAPLAFEYLGTESTVFYNPASCEPPAAPTTTSMGVSCGPFCPFPGIRQVIRPEVLSLPAAPSGIAFLAGGKIYRMTWFTTFNTSTSRYDVEITVN